MAKKKNNAPSKCTRSHKALYVCLIVYIVVAAFGIGNVIYFNICECYDIAQGVLIGLFSFTGLFGSVSTSFYFAKAKAENEIVLQTSRYEQRLSMAERVFNSIENGKISSESITLVKMLISDNSFTDMQTFENNSQIPSPYIENGMG